MKKITSLLAAAFVASIPASAFTFEAQMSNAENFNTLSGAANMYVAGNRQMQKAPSKITSASDIFGLYTWSGVSQLTGSSGQVVNFNIYFEAGASATEVVYYVSLRTDVPLKAVVDPAASTITFRRQDMAYNTQYGKNEEFWLGEYVEGSDGKAELMAIDSYTAQIDADGNILFEPYVAMGIGISPSLNNGWFAMTAENTLEKTQMFEYKAEEWKSCGKATFTDGWMVYALKDEYRYEPYEVSVMQDVNNPERYLIVNPFGEGTPLASDALAGFNVTPQDKGYIVVNATDPNLVYLEPRVYSGFTLDNSEQGDGSQLERIYCLNLDGYYMAQGYTAEEVGDIFFDEEIEPSTKKGDVITLNNTYFGITMSPVALYGFGQEQHSAKIVLDNSAVEGVEVDENAPVRYFNLQGVEIANPEQGQIVIKRQGNKATKVAM